MTVKTGLLFLLSCFVLTFFAAFVWRSFALSLVFCSMQFSSFLWLVSLFDSDTHNEGFNVCSHIGTACTFLGVFMLLLPLIGLPLFSIVYIFGTICTLASILFLKEPSMCLKRMFDQIKDSAAAVTHDGLTHSKRLFDWLKSEVQVAVLGLKDASDWKRHTERLLEYSNSETGCILLGLCALLFPLVALALCLCNVFCNFFTSGSFLGLGTLSTSATQPQTNSSNRTTTGNNSQPTENVAKPGKAYGTTLDQIMSVGMKFFQMSPFLILVIAFWDKIVAFGLWLATLFLWFLLLIYLKCFAYVIYFAVFFIIGAGCTIVGVWLRFVPGFGLTSCVFYTVGNVCIVKSTLFLKSPSEQLEMMFDNTRAQATTGMITSFVLTLITLFWWKSFVLALVFCILYILSTLWYCLYLLPLAGCVVKIIHFFQNLKIQEFINRVKMWFQELLMNTKTVQNKKEK